MKTIITIKGVKNTLLLLTGGSIALGPVFLLFVNPQALTASERLSVDSFLTPYFIVAFFVAVIATGRLGRYVFDSWKQTLPLSFLWLTLLLASAVFNQFEALDFNASFLGAVGFYIAARGSLRESPALLSRVLHTYALVSGLVALFYVVLIGTPLAPMGGGRYFFLGENPNSYSARMAIGVATALFLQKGARGAIRWGLILSIVCQIFVIYLSGSRGAILMIAVAFGLALFSSGVSPVKRLVYIFGGVFAVFLVLVYLSSSGVLGSLHVHTLERILSFVEEGETAGRTQLWGQALGIFADNPIIGIGGSNFPLEMAKRYNDARDAHNLFIFLLASSGIVGFCCFVSFSIPLLWRSFKVWRSKPMALAISLPMFLAMFKMGGILSYSLMWFVFSLSEALVSTDLTLWTADKTKH